ncbi:NAD(P)-binding domain-containing protein [Thiotrichales bacterium 19X7-9]|nr:NAD(P)-binding domain-containing protein [Thiotrichales bacterium 19X7-9]
MNEYHQFIIIGAGPAGLQMGYDLQKLNLDYVILEQDQSAGGFFKKFPIHRTLISINKPNTGFDNREKNLRWDWNSLLSEDGGLLFEQFSKDYFPNADFMIDYLNEFQNKYQINTHFDTQITEVNKEGDLFIIKTNTQKTYSCHVLIVATGVSSAYTPPIKGFELTEKYFDLSLDKSKYKNKRVLIIGKGNSAFETADYLIDTASHIHLVSPTPLKFAWKSHYVGHLRAVNNNFLDTYQLKSLNAVLNADIVEVNKKNNGYTATFNYHFASGEVETIYYDYIISATGFKIDADIFSKSLAPEMTINNRFPKLKSYYESTNIRDLYFIGTLMQSRDFKRKQSGFIHGFRYNVRFLSQYLNWRYNKQSMPCETIRLTVEKIKNKILSIIDTSSALWQQTGYFCDVIALDKASNHAIHFASLPLDYVYENHLGYDDYLTITLEFGQEIIDKQADVFQVDRVHKHDHANADKSTFIHPIIRFYHKNKLYAVHHIIEDLEALWLEQEHTEPLEKWLVNLIEGKQTSFFENAQLLPKRGKLT